MRKREDAGEEPTEEPEVDEKGKSARRRGGLVGSGPAVDRVHLDAYR